ncbi:MAG: general stress protein CsbD [Flavobacteriaceae bacterium]|nr:general stress protein CsbD [Flavobacteriaceae bacterium]
MKDSPGFGRNWRETKEKLKIKFKKLTDDDLLFVEGKQPEMINRLQVKLGISREEINKIIANL